MANGPPVCPHCGGSPTGGPIPWVTPRAPVKCPICLGCGSMPYGFYNESDQSSSAVNPRVPCQACNGRGVV